MARGFVVPSRPMDWHSRKVLAWRVSVTCEWTQIFCVAPGAPESLRGRHGAPLEISFSTQIREASSQVTPSPACRLKANGIPDQHGRQREAGRITCSSQRLWKSVKYEEVYLSAYESGSRLREL